MSDYSSAVECRYVVISLWILLLLNYLFSCVIYSLLTAVSSSLFFSSSSLRFVNVSRNSGQRGGRWT